MSKQYLPNKPTKYDIRFYRIQNSEYIYYFYIFDNGKGNRIKNSQTDRYTSVDTELRLVLNYFIKNNPRFDDTKTNELYVAMYDRSSNPKK